MSKVYGPYSPIRKAGNTYFTSGQIGVEGSDGKLFKDIASQTKQALANLQDVLTAKNLTLQDVVKTTVYLKDMDDFASMNSVYQAVFTTERPARSTIGVQTLPVVTEHAATLVEIEAIAYKDVL